MDDLIRALPGILRQAGDMPEVVEAAAMAAWRRVAGETLRGCAVPFRLYRKTLIVAVPDISWQKQLEAMSGHLLFRLNSVLSQTLVTYIEFRIDPQTVRRERERLMLPLQEAERAAQEARALRCAKELDKAAGAIRDTELRRRFLLAAGSCMDARQTSE